MPRIVGHFNIILIVNHHQQIVLVSVVVSVVVDHLIPFGASHQVVLVFCLFVEKKPIWAVVDHMNHKLEQEKKAIRRKLEIYNKRLFYTTIV